MGVCDVPVISKVCDAAGEGAGTLVAAPFEWLASTIGGAAAWMFENVWQVLDTTTLVDLTKPAYLRVYNVVFGIAILIMLLFFLLQLVTGVIRRDPSALSRAALGLAKSVLGGFLAVTLLATLLEITDQLSIGIVHATGTSMEQMGDRIAALAVGLTAINLGAPGVGAVLTIFLGGLAISGAAIVWFSLLIRKALLLVAVVLAPIALSGASWDATKSWVGKWAAFVIALAVSKLVVVVVFLVAVNQVSAPIDADLASIADPIAGIVLMFVAAFAPYMVYKFISFTGIDYWQATESEREARQSLNPPIMPGRADRPGPSKVLDDPGAGKSGGGSSPGGGNFGSSGGGGPDGAATTAGGTAGAGVIAGVGAARTAASSGPKAGSAVGNEAESHAADAAGGGGSPGSSHTSEPSPSRAPSPGPSAPGQSPAPAPASGSAPASAPPSSIPTKPVESVPGEPRRPLEPRS